jgi:hypothetical protein
MSMAVAFILCPRHPRYYGGRWIGVRDARAQSEGGEAKRASDGRFGQDFHQLHRATPFTIPRIATQLASIFVLSAGRRNVRHWRW